MSTVDMRSDVTKWLAELDDDFLAAVHTIVGNYVAKREDKVDDPVVGYDIHGNPKHAEATMDEYEARLKRAEEGEFITASEFKKQAATWLKPTK